eukprot:TRINITY_DN32210_c0_g1_i1.p1 TRINITY_DN32210_c0_g1~~TRINITY_DN32210_c0_g1_i1.p1  ORF type:complete len:379 (+),score=140.98 TRINITY_DN32210_c0_g1_i1:78-1214(+)
MSPAPPAPGRPAALVLLKEDLRTLLDAHPKFHAFFWQHPEPVRAGLVKDWQGRYAQEDYDYSGRSKHLREWVEKLLAAGMFDGEEAGARFAAGEKVRVRDAGEAWREGVVHTADPLRVRPLGGGAEKNWRDALWDEVERLAFSVGEKVRVTDDAEGDYAWRGGVVKALDPLRVRLNGGDGAHEFLRVEPLPPITFSTFAEEQTAHPAVAGVCLVCRYHPPFASNEKVAKCCDRGHIFHAECLVKAFERAPYCPACRFAPADSAAALVSTPAAARLRPGDVVTARGHSSPGVVLPDPTPTPDRVAVDHSDGAPAAYREADLIGPARPPAVGARLVVCGLASAAALNGAEGACVGFLRGRVVVEVGGARKAFKIGNVRLA